MFYITMGFFFAFLISNIWWGRSKSTAADIVFLTVLAANVFYAVFLIGYAAASGWENVPFVLSHIVMLAILVYMTFRFAKYTSKRRLELINAHSA